MTQAFVSQNANSVHVLKGNQMKGYISGEVVGMDDESYTVLNKETRSFVKVPKALVKREPKLDSRSIHAMLARATEAANMAGDAYVATGAGWFPCGSCHLTAKGKQTKQYKALLAAGAINPNRVYQTRGAVIEIPHKYQGNQSYYLARACNMAAKAVLEAFGFSILSTWEYID